MVDCEMEPECDRPATRRLVIEYPRGETCEEYYCDGHSQAVREDLDLNDVSVVETESLR